MKSRKLSHDPEDYEKLKLCFARYCWTRRNQLTPKGRITWSERFEEMFGVSLREYAEMMMKKNGKQGKAKAARREGEGT